MDIPLLRTLTKKSKLGFGKYADIPIQQIFDYKQPTYLRWIYYNYEGITFTDDILNEIPILKDERINKPGKNPEMVQFAFSNNYDCLNRYITKRVQKNRLKAKYMCFKKSTSTQYFSKSLLQRKNQGH